MPILNHQQYMLPVLEVLSKNDELQRSEIYSRVARYERRYQRLTAGEEKLRHEISGTLIFDGRVHWALQDLKDAELVQRVRRGAYKITVKGKKVHAETSISIGIDRDWLSENCPPFAKLAKQRQRLRKQRRSEASDSGVVNVDADQQTPTEQMESTYSEIKEGLRRF